MNLKPKHAIFFTKDEFYCTLKEKSISDEEYDNSEMLYTELNMTDMSDLNDLYNAQDVILLCEIFENRFQVIYEKICIIPEKLTRQVN